MKKSTRCLQGILCAALVCAMLQAAAPAMPAIAAEIEARFNSVRLELNGNTVAEEGESYTLPNGQSVPYSILYNDTTYLPIRKVCELLNIEVTWDQEGNTAGIVTKTGEAAENADRLEFDAEEYEAFQQIFTVKPADEQIWPTRVIYEARCAQDESYSKTVAALPMETVKRYGAVLARELQEAAPDKKLVLLFKCRNDVTGEEQDLYAFIVYAGERNMYFQYYNSQGEFVDGGEM